MGECSKGVCSMESSWSSSGKRYGIRQEKRHCKFVKVGASTAAVHGFFVEGLARKAESMRVGRLLEPDEGGINGLKKSTL